MAGHNRWTKIKRQKEAMGATKGKLFTKVIREITIAARDGGGDPAGNNRLRAALDAARAANMPTDNIQRAIKRGTGELEGVNYEEITYEGYGPAGVALIVECVTDNRNRTAGEVRHLFGKGGGNLGESGSVAWMFDRVGMILVGPGKTEEQMMELAIEAGASDVIDLEEDGFEVRTELADLHGVGDALQAAGLEVAERKLIYAPKTPVDIGEEQLEQVMKLVDLLEECDDVQEVHANFETA
jgi:YebC/PmpR family DNA-binding regulatory protein